MQDSSDARRLMKFMVTSAACLFFGAVHGVVQVLPPIRAWLNAVGSPYGGPGRMIDPLAHAHLSVVGGVIIFTMGAMYYFVAKILDRPIHSRRMVAHSFWWTTLGMLGTYGAFMVFGIVEGCLFLSAPDKIDEIHRYYGPVLSLAGSVMTIGLFVFFANLLLTLRNNAA